MRARLEELGWRTRSISPNKGDDGEVVHVPKSVHLKSVPLSPATPQKVLMINPKGSHETEANNCRRPEKLS
jgi:hypothetical protein